MGEQGTPTMPEQDATPAAAGSAPEAPAPTHDQRPSASIVLLRHGETEWSRTGRHTSVTDLPLTASGEDQARRVGGALHGRSFDLVLVSPRIRARRTAELAGYGEGALVEEDLAEWDYGAYEGLTSVEIAQRRGSAWSLWDDGVPPGATPGESSLEVRRRADAVLARAEGTLRSGGDVLFIAHGHMLRAIAVAWLGLPPRDGHIFALWTGTMSELGFEHGRHVVVRWNAPPG